MTLKPRPKPERVKDMLRIMPGRTCRQISWHLSVDNETIASLLLRMHKRGELAREMGKELDIYNRQVWKYSLP